MSQGPIGPGPAVGSNPLQQAAQARIGPQVGSPIGQSPIQGLPALPPPTGTYPVEPLHGGTPAGYGGGQAETVNPLLAPPPVPPVMPPIPAGYQDPHQLAALHEQHLDNNPGPPRFNPHQLAALHEQHVDNNPYAAAAARRLGVA